MLFRSQNKSPSPRPSLPRLPPLHPPLSIPVPPPPPSSPFLPHFLASSLSPSFPSPFLPSSLYLPALPSTPRPSLVRLPLPVPRAMCQTMLGEVCRLSPLSLPQSIVLCIAVLASRSGGRRVNANGGPFWVGRGLGLCCSACVAPERRRDSRRISQMPGARAKHEGYPTVVCWLPLLFFGVRGGIVLLSNARASLALPANPPSGVRLE